MSKLSSFSAEISKSLGLLPGCKGAARLALSGLAFGVENPALLGLACLPLLGVDEKTGGLEVKEEECAGETLPLELGQEVVEQSLES